jgi:hypothetical protein
MTFNDMFDFIYSMALGDAMNRVSAPNEKTRIKECIRIKETVISYANSIINKQAGLSFDDTAAHIQEHAAKIGITLSFGKTQKLINMTLKYLYIKYYDNPDVIELFNNCHAPMDSVMRDFVYSSYTALRLGNNPGFPRTCCWSTLGSDQNPRYNYDNYQSAIISLIEYAKKHNLSIRNRIEFDFLFWQRAKSLSGSSSLDYQQKKALNIWLEVLPQQE